MAGAMAIQNGSHPSPPINPVLDVMEDLQEEVNDITVGFETRLRRIKREGDRAFAMNIAKDIDNILAEGQDEPLETVESSEPLASILPVPEPDDSLGRSEEDVLREVSDSVLGRSKDEVVEAFGRAEKQKDGDEEVFSETVAAVSEDVTNIVHEEL